MRLPKVTVYHYWFRRRPLVVETLGRVFHWRCLYGLQVGPWFIGAIKGQQHTDQ